LAIADRFGQVRNGTAGLSLLFIKSFCF